MAKLKKCSTCNKYTLKEECKNCGEETKNVHYRFIKIRDAPKDSDKYFAQMRAKKMN
ncbi:hypothetical protein HN747_04440 [archaeon]|jgi:rRNA maturation protein Nop10|nr:hypothetical protein [archaeon]